MRVSKRTGKRVLRKRVYRKKSSTKINKSVKQYVKRAIHSQIENKRVTIERAVTFGSVLGDNTLSANALLPYTSLFPLPIGTTQGTRLSNQITVRKLMLRYVIRPTTYQAGVNDFPQPANILILIGNYRQYRGVLPTSLEVGQLFDSNATANGPQSDLSDLCQPLNRDAWDIKVRRVHKCGMALHAGAGNQPNYSQFANNDYPYNVISSINLTKYASKKLRFNDSQGSIQNPGLFIMFEAIPVNGGIFPATQRPFAIDYWIDLEYEDA